LKGAGNASLFVQPTGRARAKLARSGRVKLKLGIALTPKGGSPSRLSRVVVLHLGG
jgi:hypothetical protein